MDIGNMSSCNVRGSSLSKKTIGLTAVLCLSMILGGCGDDNSSSASVNLKNAPIAEGTAPAFLKKGDKIALLSPSYTTPDSTIQKTADVLEDWGFKPVIGKSVGQAPPKNAPKILKTHSRTQASRRSFAIAVATALSSLSI